MWRRAGSGKDEVSKEKEKEHSSNRSKLVGIVLYISSTAKTGGGGHYLQPRSPGHYYSRKGLKLARGVKKGAWPGSMGPLGLLTNLPRNGSAKPAVQELLVRTAEAEEAAAVASTCRALWQRTLQVLPTKTSASCRDQC